jgi:esterase/lipase superfamily enzyme
MNKFGVSTHLYHGERLKRDHVIDIAARGFDAVEVFATRSHFDYHDASVLQSLAEWLQDARLQLHSVHAPIVDSLKGDKWGLRYSTATHDKRCFRKWKPR